MKKGIIITGVCVALIFGIFASYSSTFEQLNMDMTRTRGTISTMDSTLLGDPSATVTVVEFGDYQCNQCYNLVHNEKSSVFKQVIDSMI